MAVTLRNESTVQDFDSHELWLYLAMTRYIVVIASSESPRIHSMRSIDELYKVYFSSTIPSLSKTKWNMFGGESSAWLRSCTSQIDMSLWRIDCLCLWRCFPSAFQGTIMKRPFLLPIRYISAFYPIHHHGLLTHCKLYRCLSRPQDILHKKTIKYYE